MVGGEFRKVIEGMLQNKTGAFAVDPYQLLLTYLSATFLINPSNITLVELLANVQVNSFIGQL